MPRRAAAMRAAGGELRPARPMNPRDSLVIREARSGGSRLLKSAAAKGLLQMLPWQMNSTDRGRRRLSRASADCLLLEWRSESGLSRR